MDWAALNGLKPALAGFLAFLGASEEFFRTSTRHMIRKSTQFLSPKMEFRLAETAPISIRSSTTTGEFRIIQSTSVS